MSLGILPSGVNEDEGRILFNFTTSYVGNYLVEHTFGKPITKTFPVAMASNTNSNLNDTLLKIQHTVTKNMFKNPNLVKPNLAEKVHGSIFKYNSELGLLFCSHCRISLGPKSFEVHFRDNHVTMYKDMKGKKTLSTMKATIQSLTYHSIDQVQAQMVPEAFFFADLDVNMNGFKCRDCTFVHPDRKQLRVHHNKTHETVAAPKGTNTKAPFVMENIPLQTLGGFDKNKKIFFIPKLPQHTRQADKGSTEDAGEREDADYSISETPTGLFGLRLDAILRRRGRAARSLAGPGR